MFKKIYIHIGPHKTGSSFIQLCLLTNKDTLLKNGYVYPDFSNEIGQGHHLLANKKKIESGELQDILSSYAKTHEGKILILSAENFSRYSKEDISRFYNITNNLSKNRVEVILFLRNPVDRLRSFWCEMIKHKITESQSEFLMQHISGPRKSLILNPYILYNNFNNNFNKINLVNYDDIDSQNIYDIVDIFLNRIGIKKLKIDYPHFHVNKSFSLAESEIYRNVNIILHKNSLKPLMQADFKNFIKQKKLQKHIDSAEENIKEYNFNNSPATSQYRKFLKEFGFETSRSLEYQAIRSYHYIKDNEVL